VATNRVSDSSALPGFDPDPGWKQPGSLHVAC
jgi:hypothetical protein